MLEDFDARVAAATDAEPVERTPLDGGMVGTVHRVALADGRTVVAKTGDTDLTVEAAMLRALGERGGLPVPGVYHADEDLLVLEFVAGESTVTPAVERDAAAHLAGLHDATADGFGFERDTMTGRLSQPNPWTDSWTTFFADYRLRHAAAETARVGNLPPALRERVERVAADCDALLAEPDAPALVHGDVWTNNLLVRDGEVRAFLDPACYYGHPEVELAYADWTDTFGDPFFEAYRAERGLAAGFAERRNVYVLYPILSHVFHFDGEYLDELDAALDRLGY